MALAYNAPDGNPIQQEKHRRYVCLAVHGFLCTSSYGTASGSPLDKCRRYTFTSLCFLLFFRSFFLPSAFILSFGNNNRHVLSEQPCGHSSSPCLLSLPTLLLQATARTEQKPGAHQRLRQNSAYGVNAPYSPALT